MLYLQQHFTHTENHLYIFTSFKNNTGIKNPHPVNRLLTRFELDVNQMLTGCLKGGGLTWTRAAAAGHSASVNPL